jgi:formate dehydrogenase subunit gamma
MGTLGMQGAYSAMREGYVDETWAKEHHELWYNDVKAGKIPAQRSELPGASASANSISPSAQA